MRDRFEDTAQDLLEYGKLRLDAVKLGALEHLSVSAGGILSTVILLLVGGIALVFLAVTLTLLLACLTGSTLCATAIMTGVFIVLFLILYLLRKRLFVNRMVRVFGKMLFEKERD